MFAFDTNVIPMPGIEEEADLEVGIEQEAEANLEQEMVVRQEILDRINDSLRVERDWRSKGQSVQQIYKGKLSADGTALKSKVRFNILNSNVGILLPSLFSRPPKADVRPRASIPSPVENETCDILEKMCNVFLDDTQTFSQIKNAVKEVLLPGRGTVRVRWDPIVEETEVPDPMNPMAMMQQVDKLLDQMYIEHVYWENYTQEAVSSWTACGWVAFRHLFTEKQFDAYFANSKSYQMYLSTGKRDEIFKWTDYSASKIRPDGDRTPSYGDSAGDLQDKIKKAIVWEFWDKSTREVIWICNDMNGHILRIDPDPLGLENFFPNPCPLLSVTTTDTLIPTPEYEIYQDLAKEIDELTDRIYNIAKRIKVRGAYNGAQENLAEILKAEDGMMHAVNGVDIDFDIAKHIYVVSNADNVAALQALYQSRMEAKQAMYEVTGISDIVRGQSKASETLGAQKIKSQFATLRIQDRKEAIEYFCRDLIKIMCDVIATHFDPQSIFYFTGIQPTPEAMMMLQMDGLRNAKIDVETDSTVAPDEQAEIEAMAQLSTALGAALGQLMPLIQGGILPLPIAVELIKMLIKPFKNSRNISNMLDQVMMMMMGGQAPLMAPPGMPGAPGAPPGMPGQGPMPYQPTGAPPGPPPQPGPPPDGQ